VGLTAAGATTLPATEPPAALADATRRALADPDLDSVLVVVSPPLPEAAADSDAQVSALAAAIVGADKTVLATVAGRASGVAGDLPHYSTVEEAVRALGHAVRYAAWRRRPAGRYPEPSDVEDIDPLSAYGISPVPHRSVEDAAGAVAAAGELGGGPMALKTATATLRHRLDLGAVRLDVVGPDAIRRVYAELARDFGPTVVVQPMAPAGIACVVEAVEDPAFGPIVGFGLGGVATELLGDKAWRPAPLSDADAEALVRAPRAAPLLFGYGGTAPVDVAALVDLLMRVGQLADERPDVKRVLLNPVLAHPSGLTVLHATVETGPATTRPDTGPRRLR
jgi:acyl-CoA synthetase (NDP forming)